MKPILEMVGRIPVDDTSIPWVSTKLPPHCLPAIPIGILHWLLASLSAKYMPLFERLVVIASACHKSGDAEKRGMEAF